MRTSLLLIISWLCLSQLAVAHDLGDGAHITTIFTKVPAESNAGSDNAAAKKSYSTSVQWTMDITLQELLSEFPEYDIDENGRLTSIEYGAIDARKVAEYVRSHLNIAADSKPCELAIERYDIVTHKRADFLQFPLLVKCSSLDYHLAVDYNLFFAENPYHQGTWSIVYYDQPSILYFWEDERQREFELAERSLAAVVGEFFLKGMHHIAIGFDHILFLFSLLLTSVLMRSEGRWLGVTTQREALWNLFKIITAFTIAHTITLTMAVLNWVPLPNAVLVESLIALSVMVMAFNNLKPIIRRVYFVTFAFGLVHGFGFANVLLEYDLSAGALGLSLFAFNIGVEAGQLLIAALVFVPLFYARNSQFYLSRFMPGLSLLIMAMGGLWLSERLGFLAL
ncbi:MAG: HupE/UreJ family protein [Pseudomonadales bacterium]|nr:HupE/UreJ family protein [Pseudomonadales bacterium]